MNIISPQEKKKEQATIHYHDVASKNLLLIFTRNPELGKCKTRLAASIGDQNALDIYTFLLNHTVALTKEVNAVKQVWYSEEIWENDIWNTDTFNKKLQQGADLGIRMAHAFQEGFADGFERIMVIGSDIFDLTTADINIAFASLESTDFVIGPADDGGYYLLGMTSFNGPIFQNKSWGTETVLEETLNDLNHKNIHLLETRNDVDLYEDIKDIEIFQPYLRNL